MSESADPLPSLAQLDALVDKLMLRDQQSVLSRIRAARKRSADGQPIDKMHRQLAEQVEQSFQTAAARWELKFSLNYPADLPVVGAHEEIAKAIAENQVVIVCGETGSGKTTQLPKICLELGRGIVGTIGHTQPRRIAARTVAQRIADEIDSPLGEVVGYTVRFSDKTQSHTRVRLMTDGILLAQTQRDPLLLDYDTIIIDEAHERSLNIDFLLGYLHRLLPRRPDLKLIITSATIDPERFANHFHHAPIISVSGRTYPVEMRYRPPAMDEDSDQAMREAILSAVDECANHSPGDTLIFLPGEREIRETAEALRHHHPPETEILPLFARLSTEDQQRVFKAHRGRRIVLSTNVAETSVTVPGIRHVIDPGVARLSRYSPRNKLQRLPIEPVSQASVNQRAGRCGRVGPGLCIRLYEQADFESRPRYTDPEIQRTNLASVILQMKAFGLGGVEDFPFIDPPDYRQVKDGYQTLHELGAIDENNQITGLGRTLAKLPVDPRIARMIVAGHELDCLTETLVIAAALSVQDPRERPAEHQAAADALHAKFREGASDFLMMLNLWNFYSEQEKHLSHSKLRKLCHTNFISHLRMREWRDVHSQLKQLAGELDYRHNTSPAERDRVHQAILHGLISNVGKKSDKNEYLGTRNRNFFLFPGSSAFNTRPPWVMAAEIVETTRLYARMVAPIDPAWLENIAKGLVHYSHTDPHWVRHQGRVMALERVTLLGLPIIEKRPIPLDRVDPKSARELFIHHALVEEDFDNQAPFFRHNKDLRREVELLEAKFRRHDILADPRTRFAFYDAKLPLEVHSATALEKWRHEQEKTNKRILFMQKSDLMLRDPASLNVAQFPTEQDFAGMRLPLSYHFEPGHKDDGVTVTLRLAQLSQLDDVSLDWLVPGLLEEKAIDLIRTLPKMLRVNLVPAPEYASKAVALMSFGKGDLLVSLAVALGKISGLEFRAVDFDASKLSDYLRMNIRVLDEQNRLVASGRDMNAIREKLGQQVRQAFVEMTDTPWHRDNIRKWDFGDLPRRVEIRRRGTTLQAFPALVDLKTTAGLRLLESEEAAQKETRAGVRRLFASEFNRELQAQVSQLQNFQSMKLHYAPLGGGDVLKAQLVQALADRLITDADIRSQAEYEWSVRSAWNKIPATLKSLSSIATQVLQSHHRLSLALGKKFGDALQPSVLSIRRSLEALVPPDFFLVTPTEWLEHLPRFVKALELRLDKLTNSGLQRDKARMSELQPLQEKYRALTNQLPKGRPPPAALVEGRWLLEELIVTSFAQELGTSRKVSAKRIDEVLATVRINPN